MKKRQGMRILLCVLCLLGIVGCAQMKESKDTQKTADREEIVLWSYYETKMQKKAMDELVQGFNKAQEKYTLTWEYHGPVTEFNKKLAIGITQNQLPDMVIIDNPDMSSYIKMNKFEDITETVQELEHVNRYFPEAMKAVELGGRYYGLPFCCNNVALIYNKDMLTQAGVKIPQTWTELADAAEKLTEPGRYGFAMSAIGGQQGAFQFSSFLLSSGDDLEQAGGEGTKRAFEFIDRMAEQGLMPRECVNWSQNDVARSFISGECAMMENGPWVFPALDETNINYGVAAFPSDTRQMGVLGGEVIAVLKGKNKKGSVAFMKYYSQEDTMLNVNLRANSLPPREDVAKLFLKAKPEYKVILSQMDTCIARTSYEKWSELSEQLSEAQYRVITGEWTPEKACSVVQKNMTNE